MESPSHAPKARALIQYCFDRFWTFSLIPNVSTCCSSGVSEAMSGLKVACSSSPRLGKVIIEWTQRAQQLE